MRRVLFLGDSLTWGGYGGNFMSSLITQMPHLKVINSGIGGDTILNIQRRLDSVLAMQPDVVFLMVGGNDAVSYSQPETRPYYRSAKGIEKGFITPDEFASLYRDVLLQLQVHLIQVLVALEPTEYNAELVATQRLFNAQAQTVAQSLKIPVLDLATPFIPAQPIQRAPITLKFIQDIGKRAASGWQDYETERQLWGYTYSFDGMHLMPQSAIRFADLIASFLQSHL